MTFVRLAAASIGLSFAVTTAAAHPHVLVDAKAEIVFDDERRISAVRNIWQFDPAFSAYALQGLDADQDGAYSDEELAPLAKVNVDSLQEFDFFTWLTTGDETFAFVAPSEYWLDIYEGKLTLFFTLPLERPVAVGPETVLEVFDPDYFVAFSFVGDTPATLDGAPPGCVAIYNPPKELDMASAALLGSIPRDQPDLPPELEAMASGLANLIEIDCG